MPPATSAPPADFNKWVNAFLGQKHPIPVAYYAKAVSTFVNLAVCPVVIC